MYKTEKRGTKEVKFCKSLIALSKISRCWGIDERILSCSSTKFDYYASLEAASNKRRSKVAVVINAVQY